jgi:hypothetical protein
MGFCARLYFPKLATIISLVPQLCLQCDIDTLHKEINSNFS